MNKFPTPSVPDLARAQGNTIEEIVEWLVDFFNAPRVPWSYLVSTRICMAAYRGYNHLEQLVAGCNTERNEVSRKSNAAVVRLAAPVAFGRDIQVFNLPARKFEFGRGFRAGYRVPFFFTEKGVVKLYFLQPRMDYALSVDELAMVASIHKQFILDQDFFGMPADVEYIDVSAPPRQHARDSRTRKMTKNNLSDFKLWTYERLEDRLSLISEALRYIERNNLIRPRPLREVTLPDMPLFR